MNKQKGFTLIELLVVAASLRNKSAVVLASLGTARDSGNDAAVKANLSGIRTQASLYAVNNDNKFGGLCTSTGSGGITLALNETVKASPASEFVDGINDVGDATKVVCHATANAWAVAAPLFVGGYWCVDNNGASMKVTETLDSGETECTAPTI